MKELEAVTSYFALSCIFQVKLNPSSLYLVQYLPKNLLWICWLEKTHGECQSARICCFPRSLHSSLGSYCSECWCGTMQPGQHDSPDGTFSPKSLFIMYLWLTKNLNALCIISGHVVYTVSNNALGNSQE